MAKEPTNATPDAQPGKAGAAAGKRKKEFKKKRERRVIPHGLVHIAASFNNTQIAVTDTDGRTVCWSSAGAIGFKGSRKGTPYAAQQASLAAAGIARDQYGMKSVEVRVKADGSAQECFLDPAGNTRAMTIVIISIVTFLVYLAVTVQKLNGSITSLQAVQVYEFKVCVSDPRQNGHCRFSV